MLKANLHTSEMDVPVHFYKALNLGECLMLQDVEHLQHFSELTDSLIL